MFDEANNELETVELAEVRMQLEQLVRVVRTFEMFGGNFYFKRAVSSNCGTTYLCQEYISLHYLHYFYT